MFPSSKAQKVCLLTAYFTQGSFKATEAMVVLKEQSFLCATANQHHSIKMLPKLFTWVSEGEVNLVTTKVGFITTFC